MSLVLDKMEAGFQKPVYYVNKSLQGKDLLPATKEGHFVHSACNQKAPSLLSDAYCGGSHLISFTIINLEV